MRRPERVAARVVDASLGSAAAAAAVGVSRRTAAVLRTVIGRKDLLLDLISTSGKEALKLPREFGRPIGHASRTHV